MHPRTLFLPLFGLLLGMAPLAPALPTLHADDLSRPPAAGPFPKLNLPEATAGTLPNGLRVFVLPDHRQPTITYRLLIKSGRTYDGKKPGKASLTAEMLNKGSTSPELSAEEFAARTDFLGAAVEASAGDDALAIVATGLVRDADAILGYLKAAALYPAFLESEMEREKQQAISALVQQKSNPSALSGRLANQLLYSPHPYGSSATPESVTSLERADLVAFHAATFLPNNATLAIVGDVDPKEAIAQAKAAFGDWKKGELPPAQPAEFPEIRKISVHVIDRPASVQSDIIVAARGVARDNADLPELMVVNSVLGGGFSGRLFANLREKNAFTYGAYSNLSARKLGGSFAASAQVRNAVTGAAVKEIIHELTRLTSEPIPEAELALQRNYLAGNFMMSLENNRRSAERLQEVDLYGLPEGYYEHFIQRVTSVDPKAAEALAHRYIHPGDLLIIATGKAEEIVPQLESFGPVTVYDTDLRIVPKAR